MKKGLKKTVAIAVVASMAMSLASCGVDKGAITDAAEAYAKAIAAHDSKKIGKLSAELDDDIADAMSVALNFSSDIYSADKSAVLSAIADTISYEIDEDSIEGDKESASVDVVFTMVDYEAVLDDEDNTVDLDTCLDAIADGDTQEITVTVEFDIDDGEYLVSNTEDICEDVYEFLEIDVSFTPALADAIESTEWWWDNGDGTYTNTDTIDLQLYFSDDVDYTGIYAELSYEGEVIATHDGYDAWFHSYDVAEEYLEGDFFAAGTYTITFFDANGNEFYSESCSVTVEESTLDASAVDSAEWWFEDSDGYYAETDVIDLQLYFVSGVNTEGVYAELSYDGTVIATHEGTDAWIHTYDVDDAYVTDDGNFIDGVYTVTFYAPDGTLLYSESCTVGGDVPASSGTSDGDINVGDILFVDGDFEGSIVEAVWWDYDGTMPEDGVFTTDTATIALSIEVDSDATDSIYYAFYYTTDGNFDDVELDDYVYDDTIAPSSYTNGTFYDIDYTPSSMPAGYYMIIIADNSNLDTPYLIAMCQIVNA